MGLEEEARDAPYERAYREYAQNQRPSGQFSFSIYDDVRRDVRDEFELLRYSGTGNIYIVDRKK